MFHLSIKDLENLSGIKAHTIRIWEQRYTFLKPARSDTNIRYYSNEELKNLLDISLLNKYGFKVSHIDRMLKEEIQKAIAELSPKAQTEHIIHQLILNMAKMDIYRFELVLNDYQKSNGINATISDLVYPFLQKTENFYSKISSSNNFEHLVSGTIRQKLIAGIENLKPSNKKNTTVLTFLPEGEYDEVYLLYAQYLMKQQNIDVIYLGANVPVKDVMRISVYKKPEFIYTHLNNKTRLFNTEKFFFTLSEFSKGFVIITGNVLKSYKNKIPANVVLKNSLAEAVDHFLSK